MKFGLAVGSMLCAGALALAGCAGESGRADAEQGSGTVRVVMLGSDNESLDYGAAQSYFPWVVVGNVCDSLVIRKDGEATNVLADQVVPNADASEWTITLHGEATFHSGDPVTADDVVASIRYFAESPGFGGFYSAVDVAGLKALDEHTVSVPLRTPRTDFVEAVLSAASVVYQDGKGATDDPSCSGPFTLDSYSSGTGAVLTRFDGYWGRPATLERIEVRKLNDPTARVNALVSGEADYAFDIPSSTASTVTGTRGVRVVESGVANGGAFYFALNTRVAPFDDPDVRRALKLVVDRRQLVDVIFGDYGEVGNDLFGKGLPGYADDIEQRERDVDEARGILRAAGVSELSITVSEVTPGLTDSADLLVRQLADVGVTVTVNEVDPSGFFTDLDGLHRAQMIAMYAVNQPPMAGLDTWYGADNPYAHTGWHPERFTELVSTARTSTDEATRTQAVEQLQRLQRDDGGYLIWGYRQQLSGAVEGLHGVVLNQGTPLFGSASRG
ncbi:hypothetical protein ALI22I_01275 [Saccharothrix sp. ALI-22-I]|uniref:ABC transporter substrate-binding protein n=1 Tax=Saccharothrix sp. ALI-22-I TaxID=1933778 RepID=UPI00097BB4CD|nr:ABC transporter substrate-binding protein [Saccharothrix sp. ALI-22-I]ONI92894.1 hypothetical protein ALI22I_01275 [Saccharothrix sp. ALI-22-I]